VTRSDLIQRSVVAFLECGRGAGAVFLDDPERIYLRAYEAVAQLTEWEAEALILDAVVRATTFESSAYEEGCRDREESPTSFYE
jgi:hypothetical protein